MRRLSIVLAGLAVLAGSVPLHASITGTLTADNHYALYYGKANGADLTYVGRNEAGTYGSPGIYNWSLPETWVFDGDDAIFVVAWDDKTVAQMWIGEFTLPDTSMVHSNKTDWEYFISSNSNPGENFVITSAFHTQVATELASATWAAPAAEAPQGTSPWGTIPGISSQAKFLWHDTFANNSSSDPYYAIFRTVVDFQPPPEIPEPSTLAIWSLLGTVAVVWWRRRQRKL